jgi:hypothetical protein
MKPQCWMCISQGSARLLDRLSISSYRIMWRPRADHERKPDTGDEIIGRALTSYGPLRNTNADAGKRSVEAAVLAFRRIDAAVHRAEKEIGLVADRDFEILDAE